VIPGHRCGDRRHDASGTDREEAREESNRHLDVPPLDPRDPDVARAKVLVPTHLPSRRPVT
jgi:hypothetical protein